MMKLFKVPVDAELLIALIVVAALTWHFVDFSALALDLLTP